MVRFGAVETLFDASRYTVCSLPGAFGRIKDRYGFATLAAESLQRSGKPKEVLELPDEACFGNNRAKRT